MKFFATLLLIGLTQKTVAYVPGVRRYRHIASRALDSPTPFRPPWHMTTSSDEEEEIQDDDDDDEPIAPGQMRVSEIKAELDLRGIDYKDCFDKESLATRLIEARATGKADPEIINKFNKQKLEENFKGESLEVKDEVLEQAIGSDGKLPGGMDPEMFKKLVGNPEVMTLLQSTKVQEAMNLMMTGGREKLEEKMKTDPEMQEAVRKLDKALGGSR